MTNVKSYSDRQLLKRVKELPSYGGLPDNFWILGIQSSEDGFNEFDDKFYLFEGIKFIMVVEGTTNAGTTGLLNYKRYSSKGCAVIKTDEWYYRLWKPGYHKGRMPALVQNKPIKYFRDWNKNQKVEEIGRMYEGYIGINFHTVLYERNLSFYRKLIGGWSVGCQVVNDVGKYYQILAKVEKQKEVTYCLIKEF